jgi:hypothetical protein
MKNKRVNNAISEIVGTALLLGIAIGLFAVVQIMVLTIPDTNTTPMVHLAGTIDTESESGNIIIEHHGGESLSKDTIIYIYINDMLNKNFSRSDTLDDDFWDIGEKVVYTPTEVIEEDSKVSVAVVDAETNSLVMMVTLQEGKFS